MLDKEKVFLIQNIFPTTEKYISDKYIVNGNDVKISVKLKKEVVETAQKVVELAKRGVNIPFYDIIEMKKKLEEDIK